jgi:hypothetical protein
MATTISSFVYIDKYRYMPYDLGVMRTTDSHHDDEGAAAMDLVSRLDLVDALVRDRQRESDAAVQRHAALAAGRTRRRSLIDRLTVVFGSTTLPSRIASAS